MINAQLWKPVFRYEQYYLVHPSGIIKSLHKRNVGYIMQQRKDRAGYPTVRLRKRDKGCTRYVHRILAETFISNSGNKKMVNHKNGNKLDYSLDNLEWVTRSENMKHAYKQGLCSSKRKAVVNICTGEVWNSIKEAARCNGIKYYKLKNMLHNRCINHTSLRFQLKMAA